MNFRAKNQHWDIFVDFQATVCVPNIFFFFGTQQQIISKRFWEIQKSSPNDASLRSFERTHYTLGKKSIFVNIVKFASNTTKMGMFEKLSWRLKLKLVLKILEYVIGKNFNFLDLHVFCAKIQTI